MNLIDDNIEHLDEDEDSSKAKVREPIEPAKASEKGNLM